MPSFNQAPYIAAAIESVLAQQRPDGPSVELIVVDGGSTDGTVDVLRMFGEAISWTSEKDRGQTHALNKGIERSRGSVIGWLNSDDVYYEGALDHVARAFSSRPDARWLLGGCHIIDATGKPIRKLITRYKQRRLRRWSYERLLIDNFVSQPAVFIRRDVFDEFGLFDESRHFDMDYEYWLRIGRSLEPIVTEQMLAGFRMYETSKSGAGYVSGLRQSHEIAKGYAGEIGKPWLSWLNYWYFYIGATTVYHIMRLLRRVRGSLARNSR